MNSNKKKSQIGIKQRYTIKLKNPNPLFEKWLTEWKQEAQTKNSKMQYVFQNALKSLKKYPLPLQNGKECAILHGFGTRLCHLIDKKLEEYQKQQSISTIDVGSQSNEKYKSITTEDTMPFKPNKQDKRYFPKLRSGGYAILLTLFQESQQLTYPGYMLKKDIMKNGQHLSDKSFTRPDPGTRYTAWSSMSTLINKGLIIKKGNPARYSLTEEGADISFELFNYKENINNEIDDPNSACENHQLSSPTSITETEIHKSSTVNNEKQEITKENTEIISLDSDDENSTTSIGNGEAIDEKDEYSVPETISNMETDEFHLENHPNQMDSIILSDDSNDSNSTVIIDKFKSTEHFETDNHEFEISKTSDDAFDVNGIDHFNELSPIDDCFLPEPCLPLESENKLLQNSKNNVKNSAAISTDYQKDSLEDNLKICDIIFQPNTFEIILLVDIGETAGKNPETDPTLIDLKHNNINYEVRRLSIGDYLWIARNSLDQELVLPYILERKRMDDLGKSIKDGRYHEQKFRLKNSGIRNLIYLIESHGNNQHCGLPLNTLYQASVNTKVQDNYMVKYTDNLKHSLIYISVLTNIFKSIYTSKILTGSTKADLIESDICDRVIPLMTFSEFNLVSNKTKNITIRELFMRQLVRIKGISVEKALAITEKYPTPSLLRMAYLNRNDGDNEKLLADIKYGPMKKSIGIVISKIIYQLYMKD